MSVDFSQFDFSNAKARRESWIKVLKLGAYEQTREALREGDQFCCLGVGCDIHSRITNSGAWDESDYIVPGGRLEYGAYDDIEKHEDDVTEGELNRTVADWFGFDSTDPHVQLRDILEVIPNFNEIDEVSLTYRSLDNEFGAITLNDTYKLSFEQIGKIFEAAERRKELMDLKISVAQRNRDRVPLADVVYI